MISLRTVALLLYVSILVGCGTAAPEDQQMRDQAAVGQDADPRRRGVSAEPGGKFPLKGSNVVFYNVENLFDTADDPATNDDDLLPNAEKKWTPERLSAKLGHLAQAIAMSGKDLPVLIGLCEVENRAVVERLANEPALDPITYAVSHQDSPDERGIDVALLYDTDVFTLVSTKALNVPLDNDRTRDILHTQLKAGGQIFHVFVNHWPSRREGQAKSEPKRMVAAQVLREAVDAIAMNASTHVIIMGDFNDGPRDRSIQVGLRAGCAPHGDALVDLMCKDQPAGSGSHQYDGAWEYLDQFVISALLVDQVASAGAVKDERLLFDHPRHGPSPDKTYSGDRYKGGYSDHLPIVLRFK